MNIDRDAIRARCEAATPGPWEITGGFGQLIAQDNGDPCDTATIVCEVWKRKAFGPTTGQGAADAEFIAHARQDIPALLGTLDKYEAERSYPVTGNLCELLEIVTLLHNDNYPAYSRAVDIIQSLPIDMADRDRWKARAEELERAVATLNDSHCPCWFCVHERKDSKQTPCVECSDVESKFEFDMARFTKEEPK